MRSLFTTLLLSVTLALAASVERRASDVKLAVSPKCGKLSGAPADVNAGLAPLSTYKNIVSFGDTYSDGGVQDGSTLKPATLVPPNPKAGGRSSNGPIWAENLASGMGATLKDYATAGAVIDSSQYATGSSAKAATDLPGQIALYTNQRNGLNASSTLYTLFFGMGDFEDGGDLDLAAQNLVWNALGLISSPVFAKNLLVIDNYGRGTKSAAGEAYKSNVFASLNTIRNVYKINVGYVDLSTIWNGILGSTPGYQAFGYTSSGACLVNSTTTDGACNDPDHTFYWMPGVPSAATHKVMADYINAVLATCSS